MPSNTSLAMSSAPSMISSMIGSAREAAGSSASRPAHAIEAVKVVEARMALSPWSRSAHRDVDDARLARVALVHQERDFLLVEERAQDQRVEQVVAAIGGVGDVAGVGDRAAGGIRHRRNAVTHAQRVQDP